MKLLTFILIIFSLYYFSSNNIEKMKYFDNSKIIGKKFYPHELPYGEDGIYGQKYINGIHYITFSVLYKNKILVYILDNGYIKDYFFSNIINFRKVKNTPVGTKYTVFVNKNGEPASLVYSYLYYYKPEEKDDGFRCRYYQKRFNFSAFNFELSPLSIVVSFNRDGELIYISEKIKKEFDW